jgi:hypothetical protein
MKRVCGEPSNKNTFPLPKKHVSGWKITQLSEKRLLLLLSAPSACVFPSKLLGFLRIEGKKCHKLRHRRRRPSRRRGKGARAPGDKCFDIRPDASITYTPKSFTHSPKQKVLRSMGRLLVIVARGAAAAEAVRTRCLPASNPLSLACEPVSLKHGRPLYK